MFFKRETCIADIIELATSVQHDDDVAKCLKGVAPVLPFREFSLCETIILTAAGLACGVSIDDIENILENRTKLAPERPPDIAVVVHATIELADLAARLQPRLSARWGGSNLGRLMDLFSKVIRRSLFVVPVLVMMGFPVQRICANRHQDLSDRFPRDTGHGIRIAQDLLAEMGRTAEARVRSKAKTREDVKLCRQVFKHALAASFLSAVPQTISVLVFSEEGLFANMGEYVEYVFSRSSSVCAALSLFASMTQLPTTSPAVDHLSLHRQLATSALQRLPHLEGEHLAAVLTDIVDERTPELERFISLAPTQVILDSFSTTVFPEAGLTFEKIPWARWRTWVVSSHHGPERDRVRTIALFVIARNILLASSPSIIGKLEDFSTPDAELGSVSLEQFRGFLIASAGHPFAKAVLGNELVLERATSVLEDVELLACCGAGNSPVNDLLAGLQSRVVKTVPRWLLRLLDSHPSRSPTLAALDERLAHSSLSLTFAQKTAKLALGSNGDAERQSHAAELFTAWITSVVRNWADPRVLRELIGAIPRLGPDLSTFPASFSGNPHSRVRDSPGARIFLDLASQRAPEGLVRSHVFASAARALIKPILSELDAGEGHLGGPNPGTCLSVEQTIAALLQVPDLAARDASRRIAEALRGSTVVPQIWASADNSGTTLPSDQVAAEESALEYLLAYDVANSDLSKVERIRLPILARLMSVGSHICRAPKLLHDVLKDVFAYDIADPRWTKDPAVRWIQSYRDKRRNDLPWFGAVSLDQFLAEGEIVFGSLGATPVVSWMNLKELHAETAGYLLLMEKLQASKEDDVRRKINQLSASTMLDQELRLQVALLGPLTQHAFRMIRAKRGSPHDLTQALAGFLPRAPDFPSITALTGLLDYNGASTDALRVNIAALNLGTMVYDLNRDQIILQAYETGPGFRISGRAEARDLREDDIKELLVECEVQKSSWSKLDPDLSREKANLEADRELLTVFDERFRAFGILVERIRRGTRFGWACPPTSVRADRLSFSVRTPDPPARPLGLHLGEDEIQDPASDWDIVQLHQDLGIDDFLDHEVSVLHLVVEKCLPWVLALPLRALIAQSEPSAYLTELAAAFLASLPSESDPLENFEQSLSAEARRSNLISSGSREAIVKRGEHIRRLLDSSLSVAKSLPPFLPPGALGTWDSRRQGAFGELPVRVISVDGLRNLTTSTIQCLGLLSADRPGLLITANALFPCDASTHPEAVQALAARIRRAAAALDAGADDAASVLGSQVGMVIAAPDALPPSAGDPLLAACNAYAEASRPRSGLPHRIPAPLIVLCISNNAAGRARVLSVPGFLRTGGTAAEDARHDRVDRWLAGNSNPVLCGPLRARPPRFSLCLVTPRERALGAVFAPHERTSGPSSLQKPCHRILVSSSTTARDLSSSLGDAKNPSCVVLDLCGDPVPPLTGPAGPSVLSLLLFGCVGQALFSDPWMVDGGGTSLGMGPESRVSLVLETLAEGGEESAPSSGLAIPTSIKALCHLLSFDKPQKPVRPLVPAALPANLVREATVEAFEKLIGLTAHQQVLDVHVNKELSDAISRATGGAKVAPARALARVPKPFTWTRRTLGAALEVLRRVPLGEAEQCGLAPILIGGDTGVGKTYLLLKLAEILGSFPEWCLELSLAVQSFSAAFTEPVVATAVDLAERRAVNTSGRNVSGGSQSVRTSVLTILDEVTSCPAPAAIDRLLCARYGDNGTSRIRGSNTCSPLFFASCNPDPCRDGVFPLSPALAQSMIRLEAPENSEEMHELAFASFCRDERGPKLPQGAVAQLVIDGCLFAREFLQASGEQGSRVVTGRDIVRCAATMRSLLYDLPCASSGTTGNHSSLIDGLRPSSTVFERRALAALLSLHFTFGLRTVRRRELFRQFAAEFSGTENLAASPDPESEAARAALANPWATIRDMRESVVDLFTVPAAVVRTESFKDNILAIVLAVVTRQPLLILGDDGMSKSLSIKLACSQMRGVFSACKVLRESVPSVHTFFLQFSPRTSAESVRRVTRAVAGIAGSEHRTRLLQTPTVVMEELSMADRTPSGPLRALHDLLDQHQISSHENKALYGSGANSFAFIATSNYLSRDDHSLPVGRALGNRLCILVHPSMTAGDLEERAIAAGRAAYASQDDDPDMANAPNTPRFEPAEAPSTDVRIAVFEERVRALASLVQGCRLGSIRALSAFARAGHAIARAAPGASVDEICERAAAAHLQGVNEAQSREIWSLLKDHGVLRTASQEAARAETVLSDLLAPGASRRPLLVLYSSTCDLELWLGALKDADPKREVHVVCSSSWPGQDSNPEQTRPLWRIRCAVERGGFVAILNPEGLLDGIHALLNDAADSSSTTIQMRGAFENVNLAGDARIVLFCESRLALNMHPAVLSRVAVVNSGYPIALSERPMNPVFVPPLLRGKAALASAVPDAAEFERLAVAADVVLDDLLDPAKLTGTENHLVVATLGDVGHYTIHSRCLARNAVLCSSESCPDLESFLRLLGSAMDYELPDSWEDGQGRKVLAVDLLSLRAHEVATVLLHLGFVFPELPDGCIRVEIDFQGMLDTPWALDRALRVLTRRAGGARVVILISRSLAGNSWIPGQHLVLGDLPKSKVRFDGRVGYFDIGVELSRRFPEWPQIDRLFPLAAHADELRANALNVAMELLERVPLPQAEPELVTKLRGALRRNAGGLIDVVLAQLLPDLAETDLVRSWGPLVNKAVVSRRSLRSVLISTLRRAAFLALRVVARARLHSLLPPSDDEALGIARAVLSAKSTTSFRRIFFSSDELVPEEEASALAALAVTRSGSWKSPPFPFLEDILVAAQGGRSLLRGDVASALALAFPDLPALSNALGARLAVGLCESLANAWGSRLVAWPFQSDTCVGMLAPAGAPVDAAQVLSGWLAGKAWLAVLSHLSAWNTQGHLAQCLECAGRRAIQDVVFAKDPARLGRTASISGFRAAARLALGSGTPPCAQHAANPAVGAALTLWEALSVWDGERAHALALGLFDASLPPRFPKLVGKKAIASLLTALDAFNAISPLPVPTVAACLLALSASDDFSSEAGAEACAQWLIAVCRKRERCGVPVFAALLASVPAGGWSRWWDQLVDHAARLFMANSAFDVCVELLVEPRRHDPPLCPALRLAIGSRVIRQSVEEIVVDPGSGAVREWPALLIGRSLAPLFEFEPLRNHALRCLVARFDERGVARLGGLVRAFGDWIAEYETGFLEGPLASLVVYPGFLENKNLARIAAVDQSPEEDEMGFCLAPAKLWCGLLASAELSSSLFALPHFVSRATVGIFPCIPTHVLEQVRAAGLVTTLNKCPCGYIYGIGECGMPMEARACPGCGAPIGGQNHTPVAGNAQITAADLTIWGVPLNWFEPAVNHLERELTPLEYRLLSVLMLIPLAVADHGGRRVAQLKRHWEAFKTVAGLGSDSEAQVGLVAFLARAAERHELAGIAIAGSQPRGGLEPASAARAALEQRFSAAARAVLGTRATMGQVACLRELGCHAQTQLKPNPYVFLRESTIAALEASDPQECERKFAPRLCHFAPAPDAQVGWQLADQVLEKWFSGPDGRARVLDSLRALVFTLFPSPCDASERLAEDKELGLQLVQTKLPHLPHLLDGFRAAARLLGKCRAADRHKLASTLAHLALSGDPSLPGLAKAWQACRYGHRFECQEVEDVGAFETVVLGDLLLAIPREAAGAQIGVDAPDDDVHFGATAAGLILTPLVNAHNELAWLCLRHSPIGTGRTPVKLSAFGDSSNTFAPIDWARVRGFAMLLIQRDSTLPVADGICRTVAAALSPPPRLVFDDWPRIEVEAAPRAVVPIPGITQDERLPDALLRRLEALFSDPSPPVARDLLEWAQFKAAELRELSLSGALLSPEFRVSLPGAADISFALWHLTAVQTRLLDEVSLSERGGAAPDIASRLPLAFCADAPGPWKGLGMGLDKGEMRVAVSRLMELCATEGEAKDPEMNLGDWLGYFLEEVVEDSEPYLVHVANLKLKHLRWLHKQLEQ